MNEELKKEIEEILNKLKQGEFCQPNCFGCCGDNCIDITCDIVVDNFIKELYNAGYRKIPEGAAILTEEELVKTMESGYVYDTTRGNKVNIIEMARKIERKETVKEILQIITQNTTLKLKN